MAQTTQTPAPVCTSEACLREFLDSVPVIMKFNHLSVGKMLDKRLRGLSKSKLKNEFCTVGIKITSSETKL